MMTTEGARLQQRLQGEYVNDAAQGDGPIVILAGMDAETAEMMGMSSKSKLHP